MVAIRTFLLGRGIPCTVINITRHRKPDAADIYYPENAMQLLRLLRRLRYDIIHLHVGGMLSKRLLGLGLVCSLMPQSKSVLTFHSGGYPSTSAGQSTGPGSLAGFVLRRFDRLIGVNPEIMEFFRKLRVAPDCARLISPYAFTPEPSAGLPEPLNSFFAQHRPILISVGLLEPEYDLPLQIEVLGEIRKKFPTAGLVIIGSGSLEADLRIRVQTKPYAAHLMLSGDVAHAATLAAIARADVMLRTTLYDGDAISVREALGLGTPVIASDNGMRPAGVKLIPKSSLDALRRAIEDTLAAPPTSRRQLPPDESNLEAVLTLYGELTAEKNPRKP
jgi:glycosyltransferase involved in cell wall biosynthesis